MFPNSLHKSDAVLEAASSRAARLSFSQQGEDLMLWSILGGAKPVPGVYVDVGCFMPHLYSNTKLLSLAGWRGVAIDANPEVGPLWMRDRPRDIFQNVGIAERPGLLEFFMFEDGAVNTFDKQAAQKWIDKGWKLQATLTVPTQPLAEVLRAHASHLSGLLQPGAPTFLNLDIEGLDTAVILATQFTPETFRPKVMCVEIWNEPLNPDNPVRGHLEAQGYRLLAALGSSLLFQCDG